jgi:hypothetical protein
VKESRLMNRNVDHMIPCSEKKVGFFRGFNPDWKENRPAARSAYTKITVPLVNVFNYLGYNSNLACTGAFSGIHDAIIIGTDLVKNRCGYAGVLIDPDYLYNNVKIFFFKFVRV